MSSIFRNSSTRSSMAAKFALINTRGSRRPPVPRSRCATDFFSSFSYASLDFFFSLFPLFDLLLMFYTFLLFSAYGVDLLSFSS